MKVLIYVGHPAQYLFFRQSIKTLLLKHHKIVLLIKTKDVLESIVEADGIDYINIMPQVRGSSKLAIGYGLVKRNLKILPIILKEKPDLLIGGDPSVSQMGWLLRKNRFTLTEDDYSIIKSLADLTFPFAQYILSPKVCDSGKWSYKKIGYDGYMKLAYLHPEIFKPDENILAKYKLGSKYVLVRLAKLNAHHDFGIKGINYDDLYEIIKEIEVQGYSAYISSESKLEGILSTYVLSIDPTDMHHILAFSSLLVSDSQSMSVEASMLGTPSIRYSTFAGKISVLEELENKYGLTYGILPENTDILIAKIKEILFEIKNVNPYINRQKEMLSDKINVSDFITWFIENYPESARIMKENPNYQYNFKGQ